MRLRLSARAMLVIVLALLIAACSRVSLTYRNLDLVAAWTLDDYFDLDRAQTRALRSLVKEQMAWHCTTQLPGYVEWLRHLPETPVNATSLAQSYGRVREAIGTTVRQVAPPLVEQLAQLDDRQVAHSARTLERKRREREQRYLAPPLSQQIAERADRVEDRAQTWLGPLNDAQRARIAEWSQALGDHNRHWTAQQARWEDALLEALRDRREPGFATRAGQLLQDRQSLWSADYRARFARNEQAALDLALDLHRQADAAQRARLRERLREVRQELAGIQCPTPAG